MVETVSPASPPPSSPSLADLRALSLFASLDPEDLEFVRSVVVQRSYRAGQVVLLEGAASSVLYFIRAGRVKLYKTSSRGREQVLQLLHPGESFNEVAVFDGGPNPASAQAIEPTTLLLLRRQDLLRLVRERPTFALALIRAFASRLRQVLELVEDLAFRQVTSRVAKVLLQWEAEGAGWRLTQELLAAMAASRREVVGRALRSLEQEGAIRLSRGKIRVLDREQLERLL
ncbi:MAG: Crp/Fnr family transcriptional regulator [Chloroflexi bacterium]|nr:Crp/Fnr family transcriptional regulator [Chloroflexota bacterium]